MPERHGAEKRTILPRFHNLTPRGATIFRRRSQLMTPFAPGRRPRALKAGHKTSTSPGGAERASEYFHLPVPAGMSWPNRQNHLPPNADIARRFKPIPRLTLLSPKRHLRRRANQWPCFAHPVPSQSGVCAIVTNGGCRMRWTQAVHAGGRRNRLVPASRR